MRKCLILTILSITGATNSLAQDVLWDHIGNGARAWEPRAFEMIGDLTGDGLPEILWGGLGIALVLPSEGGAAIKNQIRTEYNFGFDDVFPRGFCNVGDVDGDGIEDYSISAMGFSTATVTWAGKVFIYSGRSHQVISSVYLGNPFEFFGAPIQRLGDINGDGEVDFVIGTNSGRMRIYHGPNWAYVREHITALVTGLGDINGDGFDDYALGNGSYGGGGIVGQGHVRLISGIDGSLLFEILGGIEFETLGGVYSPGGDWNGDGTPDLVAAAPGNLGFAPSTVYVYSGVDGVALKRFEESNYATRRSFFGIPNSSGKDVNGDGFPDLIIGAKDNPYNQYIGQYGNLVVRGSAFVFSGASGALLWEVRGEHGGQRLGKQVELIDDFNGDGLADFAILSQDYDLTPEIFTDGVHAGRLTIYAGAQGDAIPVCSAGVNSTGESARLWNTGPISMGENRFELALSHLPPGQLALIVHGQLTPANPFGAGELCLGSPLSVLGLMVSPANGNFTRLGVDLEASPFTDGGNVVQAGDHWAFQALYRDQGMRNTSNALDVTFVP